jgi:hypothetical protein
MIERILRMFFIFRLNTIEAPQGERPRRPRYIGACRRIQQAIDAQANERGGIICGYARPTPKSTRISGCSEFRARHLVEYSATTVHLLFYPVYHPIHPVGHISVLPASNGRYNQPWMNLYF